MSTASLRAFLKWFSEEFEFCGAVTFERFRENIRWLSEVIPDGCTLLLINGAESEIGEVEEVEAQLGLHHHRYNQALDEVAAELPNVRICDVREIIRTPDDITFNTRHYSRRAYLAEWLAEQTQSSLRVVERHAFSGAVHQVIRLLRAPGLPARGMRVLRALRKLSRPR